MEEPRVFLQSLIDSINDQITVIDRKGEIVFVNKAWRTFGVENKFPSKFSWLGENYIAVCQRAANQGDPIAGEICFKLNQLFQGHIEDCEIDYPCHTPSQARWFVMRATSLHNSSDKLFVISHRNVTRRKLAEEKAERLSLEDPLSGLANRRKFDQFMHEEWQRCKRNRLPISVIMIDIDHFKSYNDQFGHPEGDACIKIISKTLSAFGHRAGDLAARVGGEEFAIILSDTGSEGALIIAHRICKTLEELPLESGLKRQITASLGVSTTQVGRSYEMYDFLKIVDEGLYEAKRRGRNRVFQVAVA